MQDEGEGGFRAAVSHRAGSKDAADDFTLAFPLWSGAVEGGEGSSSQGGRQAGRQASNPNNTPETPH